MPVRDMPDLASLQLLAEVADTGSLSAAATRLGVSQQAASLRLSSLERMVGVKLVHRSAHGSQLTTAGALVNEWAARLLTEAHELAVSIASLKQNRRAQLKISSSLTVAEHLLPAWLAEYHSQQTRLGQTPTDVQLRAVNTGKVLDAVRTGQADLGFIESPHRPAGLHSRVVAHDELLVVVHPGHPWARRKSPLPVSTLVKTPLIGREAGSGSREYFDDALSTALHSEAQQAPAAIEVTSAAAVRAAATAGAAPAAISSLVVADDIHHGRLKAVPVAGLRVTRKLRAVWLGDPKPPAGPVRDLLAIAAQAQASQPTSSAPS